MAGRVDFFRAFLSSALGTGLSRVLGAVRDRYIGQLLGASAGADAFNVAWTIPGAMRRFVADEGLTGALIPAMAKAEAEAGPEELERLAASTLGALLVANLVLLAVGIAAAEPLVYLFAPTWGDDPEKVALATSLTRWMMPFLLMVSLVSYAEGLLNYRGHFFAPKVAPGLVSLGFVASAILLGTSFEQPAFALVVGLLAGGTAHVLINVPALVSHRAMFGVGFAFRNPRLRQVVREMGKVVLIGAFAQVNLIVLRQIATSLETGSVTQYTFATRMVDLAQGVVAVAIGSALLPNVAAAASSDDHRQLRDDLLGAFRLAAFMLLPAAVVLVSYGLPAASIWFRTGAYTMSDVEATASAVTLMAPFMLALAAVNILKKVFFALEDRRTLLAVGGLGVLLNAAVGWTLSSFYGLEGLAATLSITTWMQLGIYLWVLQHRLGDGLGLGSLGAPFLRMTVCLLPVGGILTVAAGQGNWGLGLDGWNLFVFLGGLGAAAGSYLLGGWLLGIDEVTRVVGRLAARFRR